MVFCGKPSKGCDACRERKVKCDQEKPACKRCLKAGRVCPGYRDPLNLAFRDQSQDVRRKAHVRQDAPSRQSSRKATPALEVSTDLVQSSRSTTKSPLSSDLTLSPRPLSTSISDRAKCYFFHNFVVVDQGISKGHLDELPALVKHYGNGALMATVTCVGMAGLANTRHAPQVMFAARQIYARALRLINAALRDPIESKTDQTLSAVLLLGLFEIITCSSEKNIESWTNHIDGAASLLRFRGPEQLRTRTGLTMFMQCRSQILISSLQRGRKVNVPILEWGDIANYYQTEHALPAHRLSLIVARFSDLRAAVLQKKVTDFSTIVLSFLSIEAALAEWVTLLPERWTYTIIDSITDVDKTYGNQYHVYADSWIAPVWNSYRSVRMLCNEFILGHLAHLPSSPALSVGIDWSAQARLSRSLVNQLASDVCMSVPYLLGLPEIEDGRMIFSSPALYGFYLLWPLFCAGTAVGAPRALQLWTIRLLDGIGYSMGIEQATALADMIRARINSPSTSIVEESHEAESQEHTSEAPNSG